uniref:Uncharacterized protein n=1 Tax=Oryza glumipatula TaxID=40148 RepID=A0A0D9Y9A8_9ORYZ
MKPTPWIRPCHELSVSHGGKSTSKAIPAADGALELGVSVAKGVQSKRSLGAMADDAYLETQAIPNVPNSD